MKNEFRVIVARDAERVEGGRSFTSVVASDHEDYPRDSLLSFDVIEALVRQGYAVLVVPRVQAERQVA